MGKSLRVIIFSLLLIPASLFSSSFGLKIGAYDFTDDTAWKLYGLSPELLMFYNLSNNDLLSLDISTGVIYTTNNYHDDKHILMAIPLYLTYVVSLANYNKKLTPLLGAGLSGFYKREETIFIDKLYETWSYGYHFKIGLNWKVNKGFCLVGEIRYNRSMTHFFKENNISGIITSIGIKIPIN